MKTKYRKDSIIVSIGPPRTGKSKLLSKVFPEGSIISIEKLQIQLGGIFTTQLNRSPIVRKKEEYTLLFSIMEARAKQGLCSIIIGDITVSDIENIYHIANRYKRPVHFLIFDYNSNYILNNNKRHNYSLNEKELLNTLYKKFPIVKNFVINNYPKNYDLINENNEDNLQPVFYITDYIYEETKPFMVIGDLHGNIDAYNYFKSLAKKNNTNIYLVGDLIDYGYNSHTILHDVITNKDCTSVLGNHEKNLMNLVDKGAEHSSLVTAYTYKQLLREGKSIKYYLNELKSFPKVIEIHLGKEGDSIKKFLISHFIFTTDPERNNTYQFRDQETWGSDRFPYGKGELAVVNNGYTHIYGHICNNNTNNNMLNLNCELKTKKDKNIYKAAIISKDNIEYINYETNKESVIDYPIIKGVTDIKLFPVMKLRNEISCCSKDFLNKRYELITNTNGDIPSGSVYDKLLRSFVCIPSYKNLEIKNIKDKKLLNFIKEHLLSKVTTLVIYKNLEKYNELYNLSILPEKKILLSTNIEDPTSVKNHNRIKEFESIIDTNKTLRAFPIGITITAVKIKDKQNSEFYYIGSSNNFLYKIPDIDNNSRFRYRPSHIANIREIGYKIPPYLIYKSNSILSVLKNIRPSNTNSLVFSFRGLDKGRSIVLYEFIANAQFNRR